MITLDPFSTDPSASSIVAVNTLLSTSTPVTVSPALNCVPLRSTLKSLRVELINDTTIALAPLVPPVTTVPGAKKVASESTM